MQLEKLGKTLKRFRYPALVLLLGIALMLIPFGRDNKDDPPKPQVAEKPVTDFKTETEEQLGSILSQIKGAGKVAVMLTLRSGEQTVYQTDSALTTQTDDNATANSDTQTTVVVSRDDVGQEAVVSRVLNPTFLGAVVVCQGADDPQVQLDVIHVVASVTGLSSEKITVVKMK